MGGEGSGNATTAAGFLQQVGVFAVHPAYNRRMPALDMIQKFAIWVLPVLFAITVHEVAHGWMARRHGDSTAFMLGRLTLNPIKHVDPIGTVLVPALALFVGGFIIGWARPVPINTRNLRQPRRDMALVALAGPGANLLMALGWAMLVRLGLMLGAGFEWAALPLIYTGVAGIVINTMLMVLNLLPLPPLDGGRVLSSVLPPRASMLLDRIEPYGIFILIALLATNLLGIILWPPLSLVLTGLAQLSGLQAGEFQALLTALMS